MSKEKLDQRSYLKKWLLIAIVILCIAVSWVGIIDKQTKKYVGDAIYQSTMAYGSARALNAAISVAQSAKVGVSFGGEASFQPLEILDPVNDMVEDYATAMKYSIGSLIIQRILVEILANSLFKWIVLGVGVLLILSLFFLNGMYAFLFFKGFAFITLIRFMFVVTMLLSSFVGGPFLSKQIDDHTDSVNQATEVIGLTNTINKELPPERRAEINQQIQKIELQQIELAEPIQNQKKIVSNAKKEMQKAQNELDEITGKRDLIERLNIFSDSNEIDAAQKVLKQSTKVYNTAVESQEELTEKLDGLHKSQSGLQKQLRGKESFISEMKRKLQSLRTLFDSQKIKQILENSISAMLNLIAIFIFKTLIIPIAFLLLILRSFKWIWRIDLNAFLKNSIR